MPTTVLRQDRCDPNIGIATRELFRARRKHTIQKLATHGARQVIDQVQSNELILDETGLKCPLPVLRARKAIGDLPDGGQLRVLATDPSAVMDFEAFCDAAGHELIYWNEDAGVYEFVIRRNIK